MWLTENMSNHMTRQRADEGANEGGGEECHVLVRAGGVQQTRNFRDQIWYQIHLWKLRIYKTLSSLEDVHPNV